jgi:hypothetical protein
MAFPKPGRYTVFPATPTDGQVFIDSELVRWVYDAETELWERAGTTDSIPVATAATSGLLSHTLKRAIDNTPVAPGGFGLIVDPKLLLTSPTNPDGVIKGDIVLDSESLDITCVGPDDIKINTDCPPPPLNCESPTGRTSGLSFSLSEKFLSTLYVDLTGPKGKKGFPGGQGDHGDHGFSEGPTGDDGQPGNDIDELCELTSITYNDIDGITDTAIVNLNMVDDDGHGCKMIVTKAKLNIPADRAADKVAAVSLSRSVIYDDDPDEEECDVTHLDNWTLAQPAGDETPLNLHLLRLPKGSNDREDDPLGFNGTMTLEDFVGDIVSEYKDRLTKIDESWGRQVKQYVETVDDKARSILSDLAHQLATCEWSLPAMEYCLTFKRCASPSPAAAGRSNHFSPEIREANAGNMHVGAKNWRLRI